MEKQPHQAFIRQSFQALTTGYGSTIEGECKVGFVLTLVILLVNYLGW